MEAATKKSAPSRMSISGLFSFAPWKKKDGNASSVRKVDRHEYNCRYNLRDVIHSLWNANFPNGKGDPRIGLANALMSYSVELQERHRREGGWRGDLDFYWSIVIKLAADKRFSPRIYERAQEVLESGALDKIDGLATELVNDCIRGDRRTLGANPVLDGVPLN